MKEKEFRNAYDQVHHSLDQYFHWKLVKAGIHEGIEEIKRELVQNTLVAVWSKMQLPSAETYNIKASFWLSAPDVWYKYINPKKGRFRYVEPDKMEMYGGTQEFEKQYESIDYLFQLGEISDKPSYEIMNMHARGYTSKEIAVHFNTTESSIRKRIWKFRKKFDPGESS